MGQHSVVFRTYYYLCAQGSLMRGLKVPHVFLGKITSVGAQGTTWGTRDQTQVGHMKSKYSTPVKYLRTQFPFSKHYLII